MLYSPLLIVMGILGVWRLTIKRRRDQGAHDMNNLSNLSVFLTLQHLSLGITEPGFHNYCPGFLFFFFFFFHFSLLL